MNITITPKGITKAELRAKVNATGSFFFAPATMKAFGDSMANYSLDRKPVLITVKGEQQVWAHKLNRKAPKFGQTVSRYFRCDTFALVY